MPGFEIFGDEERKEVNDVLSTGVLFRYGFDNARNNHWKAKSFEKEFSEYMNIEHCLLVSSGTSALATALSAMGVGANDEVIVPPFTFVATVEAVIACGAIPIFADIDDTLCLSADAVEAKITNKTKAVIVVHMCGSMAHIDKLQTLCKSKGLFLIEDSCQAIGADFDGKKIGTFGDVGCFSFDSVKTITCGEGGAIITNNKEIYLKSDAISDHGHDHIGNDRGKEGHPIIGMNYRISELNAAVGLAQLRKINTILELQRKNQSALEEVLNKYDFISLRNIPDKKGDSATFLSFFTQSEEQARNLTSILQSNGFDGVFYWFDNNWHYIKKWEHITNLLSANSLHIHSSANLPDYEKMDLSASDNLISRLISIQIKISWSDSEVKRRIDLLDKSLSELK